MAVLLATVAQLACNLLPLVDGWHGFGAGPHVEAAGLASHYAHAEDTCTACHVRALTAPATPTLRLALGVEATGRTVAREACAPTAGPTSPTSPSHRSRAPPAVN